MLDSLVVSLKCRQKAALYHVETDACCKLITGLLGGRCKCAKPWSPASSLKPNPELIILFWYSCSMLVPKVPKNSQISVRILSEICQLQKIVRTESEMCQISVRKLSDANICQKSIRKDLEMHQRCVRFYKCVRRLSLIYFKKSQNSVRNILSDRFLTHFY